MLLHRRGFLSGLAAVVAAPAIVRVGNIMPVRAIDPRIVQVERMFDISDLIYRIDPFPTPFLLCGDWQYKELQRWISEDRAESLLALG